MEGTFGYRKCWASARTLIGDGLPSEEILYISVHIDSASPTTTQILVSEAGYHTVQGNHSLERNIKFIST